MLSFLKRFLPPTGHSDLIVQFAKAKAEAKRKRKMERNKHVQTKKV